MGKSKQRTRAKAKPKPKQARARARQRSGVAPTPELVTQAQYARMRGVSREAVSKAIREGRIQADARGLVDRAEADRAWAANTIPRPGVVAGGLASVDAYLPSIDGVSLTDARTLHELTKARIAALQLGREMGQLVPVATVRDQAFRAARASRDVLESIPDRISDTLSGMTDVDAIRKLLREELENALDAMSKIQDLGEAAGSA
jgi:phage terminase Nu1 subunit (DNA packaging protein)